MNLVEILSNPPRSIRKNWKKLLVGYALAIILSYYLVGFWLSYTLFYGGIFLVIPFLIGGILAENYIIKEDLIRSKRKKQTSTPINANLIKEILFYPRKAVKKVLRINTKLAFFLVIALGLIPALIHAPETFAELNFDLSSFMFMLGFIFGSSFLYPILYLIISKLAKVKKVLFEDCLKISLASTLPIYIAGIFLGYITEFFYIWAIILTVLMFSEFTKFSKLKTFFWYIILIELIWEFGVPLLF